MERRMSDTGVCAQDEQGQMRAAANMQGDSRASCRHGEHPEKTSREAVSGQTETGENEEELEGRGKVGIQRQDSHFSTALTACGARTKSLKERMKLTWVEGQPASAIFMIILGLENALF
jgi:hypothetical protein